MDTAAARSTSSAITDFQKVLRDRELPGATVSVALFIGE
jgi:hypothetical protein